MYSKEDIDQRLHGQWKPVLKRILGLSEVQLTSKGQPCPSCGGEDRYSFTDYQGRGDYFCRGCGPGDGWSLIQKVKKVDFKEALQLVKDSEGFTQPQSTSRFVIPTDRRLDYVIGTNIALLNKNDNPHCHQYQYWWEWKTVTGELIGYIGRKSDKTTHQIFYTNKGWAQGSYEGTRPLFGLETLKNGGVVYVVEGEKTWQAVRDAIPNASVITWVGGAQAVKKTDYKPLNGKRLILCPDNDKPGREAMQYIASVVHADIAWFSNPEHASAGWDLADYTGTDLEAFINEHLEVAKERDSEDSALSVLAKAIKPLGFNGNKLYFLPTGKLQVLEVSGCDLGKGTLRMLCSDLYWKAAFPKDPGINWDEAANWVIRECEKKKIYNPMSLRGNGVWKDSGNCVVHMGDHLLVNGERKALNDYDSKYIYPQRRKIDLPKISLLNDEKELLLEIVNNIRFQLNCSKDFLLSFILCAPISAYWDWRPSIWVRGPAGAGKSTILEQFVKPCLGDMCLSFEGDTTEAGIRQSIGNDALAVLFDEPEADTIESNQKIQNILKFIRSNASSSTGLIAKGTSNQTGIQYQAQCMFMLASINSIPMKTQDKDRITCLELQGREGNTVAQWQELERLLFRLPPDIHQKIFYYMISNIEYVKKVIDIFRDYFFMRTGSRRIGDQYGLLSVGRYILMDEEKRVPDINEVGDFVDDSVWSTINENTERNHSEDFVDFFRDTELALEDKQGKMRKRNIVEILRIAKDDGYHLEFTAQEAQDTLMRRGIKIVKDMLHFQKHNSHLYRLFGGRPDFQNYSVLLMRLPNAETNKTARMFDKVHNTIAVPLKIFLSDKKPLEVWDD